MFLRVLRVLRGEILVVTLLFTALTIALTWPLARGLTRDLPGGLGDPLFVSWILAWDATHLGRGLWNANIFHPHPLALAYSEHLLPQAVRVLPVYAITKNPILCYNLTFLSTFILSGIGMFLFVRELTASRPAGIIAGLAYAYAPYRFAKLPHVQVLSSEWMPFVLFGLRRYFATGRLRPLTLAGAAWVIQSLSCGYYLFFFSPVAIAYAVWELTSRRLWTDRRVALPLMIVGASAALITVPFLLPYVQLRRLGALPRSLDETIRYSADVHAYLTAAPELWIAGLRMQDWPNPEGGLFPGFAISSMAAAAALHVPALVRRNGALRRGERLAAWALAIAGGILAGLLWGWTLRLPGLKITSLARAASVAAALGAALIALSPRFRTRARHWLATPVGFFTLVAIFAIVMSFGPEIRTRGRLIAGANLYALCYKYVPGFDGLRVPARFAMIAALAFAVLAGCTAARLDAARRRFVLWVVALLIIVDSCAVPLPINELPPDYEQAGLAPLSGPLENEADHMLYRAVAGLPDHAAIIELPLGEPAFDIRYMFYSTRHWKRLVNGYSGSRPAEYGLLDQALRDIVDRPDHAWQELRRSAATHAIVHEAFYAGDRGARVSAWLRDHGARETASFGSNRMFELPPVNTFR